MALDKLHAIVSDVYTDLRDWWYCIHAHRNTVGQTTVMYLRVELVRYISTNEISSTGSKRVKTN